MLGLEGGGDLAMKKKGGLLKHDGGFHQDLSSSLSVDVKKPLGTL